MRDNSLLNLLTIVVKKVKLIFHYYHFYSAGGVVVLLVNKFRWWLFAVDNDDEGVIFITTNHFHFAGFREMIDTPNQTPTQLPTWTMYSMRVTCGRVDTDILGPDGTMDAMKVRLFFSTATPVLTEVCVNSVWHSLFILQLRWHRLNESYAKLTIVLFVRSVFVNIWTSRGSVINADQGTRFMKLKRFNRQSS